MADRAVLFADGRYRIYFTVQAGVFITVVDMTAAFIAVPSIALEFGVGLPTAQWVLAGYLLTVAMLLVPAGRLSDNIGRKALFVGGFTLGACGALLAFLSTGIVMLIGARILMGMGASAVQSSSMPIIISVFEARDRGKVLGGQMGIVGVGTVLGPVLGGLVISEFGWRITYLIISAICAVVAILSVRVLKPSPEASDSRRFDVAGALLLGGTMLGLLLALTNAPSNGWTAPLTIAEFGASIACATAFIAWERRCSYALLDLAMLRAPAFSIGITVAFVGFLGTSASYYMVPFYLQFVVGHTPAEIGMALMPAGIVTALISPLAGHTGDRFGYRRVATGGLVILVIGLACLSMIQPQSSTMWVSLSMMVLALGLASFHAPNSSAVFEGLPDHAYGVTSGSINLARNMGNVTGIALATAIITGTMASRGFPPKLAAVQESVDPGLLAAYVSGMSTSFLMFGALCVLLIGITFRLRSRGVISW